MRRAVLDPSGPVSRQPLQPHQLVDRVTRTQDLIVLCHLGIARLRAEDWSLEIDGLVRRPMRLTLADLMRRPRTEIVSIHQCCGNPMQPDVPTRRICNVVWGGARLSDVIAACDPDPAARFIWSAGADHGEIMGVRCEAFVKDLPIERLGADVLLAYEVNGAPLPAEHGFPLRLVVPGFYGTNSVKWLTRLTLATSRAEGPFTTRWYNDPARDAARQPTGDTRPVWSIAPESVIVSSSPHQELAIGEPVAVWGWAWADGGVEAIAFSDGGLGWMDAAIEPAAGHAWQRFTVTWRPERRGSFDLRSRADAGAGRRQPASGARNAIHHVHVEVK